MSNPDGRNACSSANPVPVGYGQPSAPTNQELPIDSQPANSGDGSSSSLLQEAPLTELQGGGDSIEMPMADSSRAPDATARQKSSEKTAVPVLLVVEDDGDDFGLLSRALRKTQGAVQVRWVQTTLQALELFAELERHCHHICIAADVTLPGADGFELLSSLRSRPQKTKVTFVFITGREDLATSTRATQAGADAFLLKPGRFEDWIRLAQILVDLTARSNHGAVNDPRVRATLLAGGERPSLEPALP